MNYNEQPTTQKIKVQYQLTDNLVIFGQLYPEDELSEDDLEKVRKGCLKLTLP